MKRITDEEIRRAVAERIDMQYDYETVADAQLQADKQAVEKCSDKIGRAFRKENCSTYECDNDCADVCSDYLEGVGCTLSLHFADQIIKILTEEGVKDESSR